MSEDASACTAENCQVSLKFSTAALEIRTDWCQPDLNNRMSGERDFCAPSAALTQK
jgi:hypothetical protein